jgi:hypothetical protein
MLDKQKVVNFVSAKLKEQGRKSYAPNEDSLCKYRHGKLKCAIGHIILDEEYDENLEGFGVHDIFNKIPRSLEPFMEYDSWYIDKKFLLLLQKCHDEATKRNFYKSFLKNLSVYLDMQPETL